MSEPITSNPPSIPDPWPAAFDPAHQPPTADPAPGGADEALYRKTVALLRALEAKLANGSSPSDPPVSDEKLGHFADSKFLNEKLRTRELAAFGGNYVAAYNQQIVGHGPELGALRKEVAARLGVSENRLATMFVHA